MPYLPIDNEEKVSGGQPVGQTGVATGGVGGVGGSGPQGGAKADNSYTNLTNYLQANAGNTANADAAKSAVFDPLAQGLKNTTEYTPGAVDARKSLDTAVGKVTTSDGVQGALEKAYGNTYTNQGNRALDAAISGRGVLGAAQSVAASAKPTAYKPEVNSPVEAQKEAAPATAAKPSGFAVSTPNPTTGGTGIFDPAASWSGDVGSTPLTSEQVAAMPSASPKTPAQQAAANSQFTAGGTPISGGAGHGPIPGYYMAHGGQVPEGGHYENLMNKIKGKS